MHPIAVVSLVFAALLTGTALGIGLTLRVLRRATSRNTVAPEVETESPNQWSEVSVNVNTYGSPNRVGRLTKCPVSNCMIRGPHSHAEALLRRMKEQ